MIEDSSPISKKDKQAGRRLALLFSFAIMKITASSLVVLCEPTSHFFREAVHAFAFTKLLRQAHAEEVPHYGEKGRSSGRC